MGNVQGIGGASGSAAAVATGGRFDLQLKSPAFDPTDNVKISQPAAQAAFAAQEPEIRQERVDEVRARLQDGAYKLQATLLKVAARVAPYVG